MAEPNIAESLLALADAVMYPRSEIVILRPEVCNATSHAQVALALKFKRSKIVFKALVEEWSMAQIVEAIY